jgi:hypothetical protein
MGSLERRAGLLERNGETADWHAWDLGNVAADIDRPVVSMAFGQLPPIDPANVAGFATDHVVFAVEVRP